MVYILTEKGIRYSESIPGKLEEKIATAKSKGIDPSRISGWYKLARRATILSSISRGEEPIPSFSKRLTKLYPGKIKSSQVAFSKELQGMLKEGLVENPGWEQKIQVDLGQRHPGNVTASQEEYERPSPFGRRVKEVKCKCGNTIHCTTFTNHCSKCGRDYSFDGGLLAPRSQWGEETGETASDII